MNEVIQGDALEVLKQMESESIQACVTSPPYWGLRDYGVDGQIGLEESLDEYICKIGDVFDEVKRVLKKDGTLWLNIGDTYVGSGRGGNRINFNHNHSKIEHKQKIKLPRKSLAGVPWRIAFELQRRGWLLRQDIVWSKANPMPESVKDRFTRSHEYIFLLTKEPRYFFSQIKEPVSESTLQRYKYAWKGNRERDWVNGDQNNFHKAFTPENVEKLKQGKNKRSVWTIPTAGFKGAHFAVFPKGLAEVCIKAGTRVNDFVLDPFSGSGTTGVACKKLERNFRGIELNCASCKIARDRLKGVA